MPGSRQAVELTNHYRQRLTVLRQRAELVAATEWRNVNPDDLDTSHLQWARLTALRLTELQRAGATLGVAYLAGFVAIETGAPPVTTGRSANVEEIGRGRDGRALIEALAPTLYTVKAAIAEGREIRDALRLGLQRAIRNSNEDVAHAARATLDAGIRDDSRIIGWRRVTGGGCGACLAAATGAIQQDSEVLPVHDHCECSKEPVIEGVRETVLRPTGEEMFHEMPREAQDALFAGRGGTEKADLIRSGDVPFHQLVQHQPMAVLPDGITEAPLEALKP